MTKDYLQTTSEVRGLAVFKTRTPKKKGLCSHFPIPRNSLEEAPRLQPRRNTRISVSHSTPERVSATSLRLRRSSRRKVSQWRVGPWCTRSDWAVGAKTDGTEMTSNGAGAGCPAARWLLGTARLTLPRPFLPPPPAPRPRPLAAPLPGVTRHCGPREKLRGRRHLCPGPDLSLPGRRLQFQSRWRRSLLCRLSENGGSEAGRERPGFPAGAKRRGLQARRGQVHHERVRPGPSPLAPAVGRCFPSTLSRSRSPGDLCSGMSGAARSPRPLPSRPPLLGLSPLLCTGVFLAGSEARLAASRSPGVTR